MKYRKKRLIFMKKKIITCTLFMTIVCIAGLFSIHCLEKQKNKDLRIVSVQHKEKKAEKQKKTGTETPAPPRKKAKLTLNILCTILRGAGTLIRAVFGALRITHIRVCLGVRGEDPAAAARNYGKLQAWLYPVLGVLDRFIYLQFDELRIVPDFGSAEPTVEDRVSLRISAKALFIVVAAVRVLAEFWREKVLDVFL